MSHPKIGMHYEDVRKRLKGHFGKDPVIKASMLNQVQLHEGEKAKIEIKRELSLLEKKSPFFSGAGSKQIGFGEGKRLGDGLWSYVGGKWIKVLR